MANVTTSAAGPAPLVSQCGQCGGAVKVILSGIALSCPYCSNPRPFPQAVSDTMERLRAKLRAIPAREQQLIGRQARLVRGEGVGMFLFLVIPLWLLVGGILLTTIPTPEGKSLSAIIFRSYTPVKEFDNLAAKWWVLWGFATGLALSLALYGGALWKIRRLSRFMLPQAPSAPGAPPRCRCCGADLPAGSSQVRRCEYCDVDHVLQGDHYQRADLQLETALARLERGLDIPLTRRAARANRALTFAGTFPILVGVLMPAGLFLGGTRPLLWLVPAALLLLGIGRMIFAYRLPVPEIRSVDELEPGDEVAVDNRPYLVLALWRLHCNALYKGNVAILRQPDGAGECWALRLERDVDDRMEAHLFQVAAGGEPQPEVDTVHDVSPVGGQADNPPEWGGKQGWQAICRWTKIGGPVRDLRFWPDMASIASQPPAWTLTFHSEIAEEKLLLLTA